MKLKIHTTEYKSHFWHLDIKSPTHQPNLPRISSVFPREGNSMGRLTHSAAAPESVGERPILGTGSPVSWLWLF